MIVRNLIIISAILFFAPALYGQGYDVEDTIPPATHTIRTPMLLNSPIFQDKYGLLIMPPCQATAIMGFSGLTVNLISHGDFKPLSIVAIDDSTFEVKLQSTSWIQTDNLQNRFRLPLNFTLKVLFDCDSAMYHVNYDTLNDSLTIIEDERNKNVKFIILETVSRIPEGISWVIFHTKDIRKIREFRNDISPLAELITLDEGYYSCLPSLIKRNRLSRFSINQINNRFIQFFRIKDADRDEITNVINGCPYLMVRQIN